MSRRSEAAGTAALPVRPAVASAAIARVLGAPSRPARVLGASPLAVYLAVEGGEAIPDVVAVVAASAVRVPVAMTVAGHAPAIGDPAAVRVGDGGVDLGGLWVRPARWTDPRPELSGPVAPDRLDAAVRRLAGLPATATGLTGVSPEAVVDGLAGGDAGAAVAVLGRGPGLTPAADDLLAGAMASLALLGGLDEGAVRAVLAAAAVGTTALSAALLRCAARGQVLPQAAAVLQALCGHGAVDPALRALLAVGATSGAALALGLCGGAVRARSRGRPGYSFGSSSRPG